MSTHRNELWTLEQRLLEPAVRQDPDRVDALLADDFVEFGSSGQVYDRQAVIESFKAEPGFDGPRTIVDYAVKPLSSTVALATYRVAESDTLCSSIWRQDDGRWRIVFRQGTRRGG